MNSRFKFPRRVRIHGGECGAVARALHHEAKIQTSPAVEENVFFTTNERKSMSTKTTLKRIALVAVSALGLGLFAAVSPASAGGDVTFATNITNQTIVVNSAVAQNTTGDSTTSSQAMAVFRLCVTDEDGARALTGSEYIQASVVGVPTTVTSGKTLAANSTDIGFLELTYASVATPYTVGGLTYAADSPTTGLSVAFKTVATATQTTQVTMVAGRGGDAAITMDGRITGGNTEVSDSGTARIYGTNNCYLIGAHGFSQTAWDQGTYTIRFALTDASGFLAKVQDVSVKYVTSAADSGATFTITNTGRITQGAVYTFGSTNRTSVAMTNGVAGGRVFTYAEGSATAFAPKCPALAVAIVDQDGVVESSTGLLIGDTGTAGIDFVASTSDSATVVSNTLENAFCNGTYGITTNATGTFDAAVTNNATSGNTTAFRVRYGATSTTGAFSVVTTASATVADSSVTLTATGSKNHDDAANTGLMNNGNRWTLPLTTKSAVIKVRAMSSATAPVANYPLLFSVSWNSSAAAGEVTPRTTSSTIAATSVTTDSSGYASLTLTNNTPIDGAQVTVTVSGFTGTAAGQVILWQKSKPAVVTVSGGTGMKAKTGSTNTVTWTYTDTFGAPVAGAVVDLAIAGANSATSTVVIPSTTTDANGVASYTFTDAAGVEASTTLGTTTLTATARETSLAGSRIITWVATMPVVATITGFRNDNEVASGPTSYADPVDAGVVIYDTASTGTKYLITTSDNLTRSLFLAGDDREQVAFQYTLKDSAGALVSGVPVTLTATDGLWILNSVGLPVTSRTIYAGSGGTISFIVMATKTGTHTLTLTSGTVSTTTKLIYGNSTTDARYLALSANASGTANAEKLPAITASVTDRWGNPVSGVTITVVHTGVGRLAGGAKTTSYTTDAAGQYVIEATSTEAGTASVKVTASATSSQLEDIAGYVGSTALVDDITAGVSELTGTFTFAAGTSAATAAAEAASDAAAEAIDAANAATDAANLAAEAADAATVAAEEARDAADAATAAVEELATQVATLMAALKAQITTLANTVAKIAKKVRA
jgi:hypothetical protein